MRTSTHALAVSIPLTMLLLVGSARAADDADKPIKAINDTLALAWKTAGVKPSAGCSDYEFLRRVTLDLTGRIATLDEVRAFEKDTRADKRAQLVDRLLKSEKYSEYAARLYADLLLPESAHPLIRQQFEAWLRPQFATNVSYKDLVVRLLTATGSNKDNGAVNFLIANLGTPTPAKAVTNDGRFQMEPITGRVGRVFLGLDLACVRCHNHPFTEELKQEHYWGVNAFFRQTDLIGNLPKATDAAPPVFELKDNPELNKDGLISFTHRNGKAMNTKPKFLDGTVMAKDEKRSTRREVLAELVVKHDNFAKAYVNRMWARFFGRGLNSYGDVDDFGEHNPIEHPELLDQLAKDFIAANYDTRQLIRWICLSDAYQLQSTPNATNAKADMESLFSRMPVRELTPHQRLESVFVALNAAATLTKADQDKVRKGWYAGKPTTLTCDQDWDCRLSRANRQWEAAAFMISNDEVQKALAHKNGPVAMAMAKKEPTEILDELYRKALNRLPSAKERSLFAKAFKELGDKPDEAKSVAFWQDVYWTLLNTSEFTQKH